MEFVQIKHRVCGKSSSFWWFKRYSASWSNSREPWKTVYINFDEKHFPNVLENQTRLQNSAYIIRKSLIFCILCALFEQIPSGINQDILKNPTWCRVKNSNKLCVPSHLVTWIPHTAWVGIIIEAADTQLVSKQNAYILDDIMLLPEVLWTIILNHYENTPIQI